MDNLTWGRAPLPKTDKDLYFWFRLKDQPGTAFIAGLYDMGDHHEWALGDRGGRVDDGYEWAGPLPGPSEPTKRNDDWSSTPTDELTRALQYREEALRNDGGRGDYRKTQQDIAAIEAEFQRRGIEPVRWFDRV